MGHHSDTGSQDRNLEFGQSAENSSPTLHKVHRGINNIQKTNSGRKISEETERVLQAF